MWNSLTRTVRPGIITPTLALALVGLTLAAPAALTPGQDAADAEEVTINDGVFSGEQVEEGGQVFEGICSACHMPDEFVGAGYIGSWAGQSVFSFFDLVTATMPEDNPGSLRPSEYVAVLTYLFSLNGAPTGEETLSASADRLREVMIATPPEPAAEEAAPAVEPSPAEPESEAAVQDAEAEADDGQRSVQDGVFSREQASQGNELFSEICTACHDPGEFINEGYMGSWSGQSVFDIFDLIAATMPEDNPGSLPRSDYVAILSYLFTETGVPTGDEALDSSADALRAVMIEGPFSTSR